MLGSLYAKFKSVFWRSKPSVKTDLDPISPAQYANVKDLFLQSIMLPEDEREGFLAKATMDEVIRREVGSLLKFHEADQNAASHGPKNSNRFQLPNRTRAAFFRTSDPQRQRRNLFLLGLVGFAVVFTCIGFWAYIRVEQHLRHSASEELRTICDGQSEALRQWINSRRTVIEYMGRDPKLLELATKVLQAHGASARLTGVAAIHSQLKEEYQSILKNGDFEVVGIFDPSLNIVASNMEKLVGATLESSGDDLDFLLKAVQQKVTTFGAPRPFGIHLNRKLDLSRKSIVYFATPLLIRGDVIGLLVTGESVARHVEPILKIGRMNDSGESYIVSSSGLMGTGSRFTESLKAAWSQAGLPQEILSLGIPLRDPGGNLMTGYKPQDALVELFPLTRLAAQAIAARSSDDPTQLRGTIASEYRDYRGVPVVGAWQWLPEYGFGVATELDAGEAFSILRYLHITFGSIVLALLIAGIGWGIVTWTAFKWRRRVQTQKLGSYELVRKISEGGIGEVHLARHALLRRSAAIKILKAPRPAPEQLARFEEEAKQVCRLSHPNTIQIYDFGMSEDGRFYLAMEYLRGINLAQLISIEGSVPPARALHIIRQVCESLQEAHNLGLIHRDIKPLNIMICRIGGIHDFVKVLDFGLVKNLAPLIGKTADGSTKHLIGTPLYMAPERLQKGATVNVLTDIYSIGVLLFVLLTGRGPFDGEDDITLVQEVLYGVPRSLSALVKGIPPELEQLVYACMARDPKLRAPSVAVLIDQLADLSVPKWTKSDADQWWTTRYSLQVSADLLTQSD